MKEGNISWVEMPQPDGSQKRRPVVLLRQMPKHDDYMVCAISTQLRQENKHLDCVILDTDAAFRKTGLKASSVIRTGFLAVINVTRFPGSVGDIPPVLLKQLKDKLAAYLIK